MPTTSPTMRQAITTRKKLTEQPSAASLYLRGTVPTRSSNTPYHMSSQVGGKSAHRAKSTREAVQEAKGGVWAHFGRACSLSSQKNDDEAEVSGWIRIGCMGGG